MLGWPSSRERFLGVNSAGIDDGFGLQVEDRAIFAIVSFDAHNFAAAFNEACRFNIIDGRSAEILESAQQRDGVAGVIELAVMIKNAAAEMVCRHSGQLFQRALHVRATPTGLTTIYRKGARKL